MCKHNDVHYKEVSLLMLGLGFDHQDIITFIVENRDSAGYIKKELIPVEGSEPMLIAPTQKTCDENRG